MPAPVHFPPPATKPYPPAIFYLYTERLSVYGFSTQSVGINQNLHLFFTGQPVILLYQITFQPFLILLKWNTLLPVTFCLSVRSGTVTLYNNRCNWKYLWNKFLRDNRDFYCKTFYLMIVMICQIICKILCQLVTDSSDSYGIYLPLFINTVFFQRIRLVETILLITICFMQFQQWFIFARQLSI